MRYIYLLLCLGILGFTSQDSQAQEESNQLRYLSDAEFDLAGFGGYMIEFGTVGDDFAVSTGGGGAFLFNQMYYIGGYGLSLSRQITRSDIVAGEQLSLSLNHGGIWTGVFFNPSGLVHLGVSSKFGWGGIALKDDTGDKFLQKSLFMITPQLEAQLNVARWFRVNIGGGYRICSGLKSDYYANEDFSGPMGTLTFKFGWFRIDE